MTDTRERILEAGTKLFRRRGYAGTGMNQIVAESDAALGSIYHFFPGGKEQLGREAVGRSGARYNKLIDAVFDQAPDVVAAVRSFFRGAVRQLEATGFEDACPIATVALDVASTSETLRIATAEAFGSWAENIAARLHAAGVPADAAGQASTMVIALLEGAFMLSRVSRSAEPLRLAEREAAGLVSRALAGAPAPPR